MKLPQCEIILSESKPAREILFVAGGKFPSEKYFLELAANRKIFCVDRGIEICHKLNILPEILIGDFDSADKKFVDWAIENKICVERYPVEKDFTDLQLALNKLNENFSAIITGIFGGRTDHLFSNIFTCANYKNIFLADESEIIFYLHDNEQAEIIFNSKPQFISLLAITEICEGVNINNVRWELNDSKLFQNIPNAVSNRTESDKITVSISRGILAVYFYFEKSIFHDKIILR